MGRLAWVPIPIFLAAILALWPEDFRTVYESHSLLIALNLAFSMLVSLFIIFLLGRSFLHRHTAGLLVFSGGIAFWGMSGLVGVAAAHGEPNTVVTIHNSCIWLSAFCHMTGALLSFRPISIPRPGAHWLIAVYGISINIVALIAAAALEGWMPVFFIRGQGGTPFRQFVLITAIIMFVITAAMLGMVHRRQPSPFAYWYSLALALISIGLFGVMIEPALGTLMSWIGRTAQYLGGAYILVAAVRSARESSTWEIPLEAALSEARQHYEELFKLSADGIVVHELASDLAHGDIIQVNPALCDLLTYTEEELCSLTLLDILSEGDRAAVQQELQAMSRDKVLRHERTLLTGDGRRIPVEISSRLFDFQGRPRVMSTIRDITERRASEAALRKSEALYRAIGESIDYGVWVCTPDGHNIYVSESFLRLVGLTQQQCSNFGWGDVLHPDDAERTISAWKECVRSGGTWDIEHRFRGVDGQYHHILARGVPVKSELGEIVCWAGINLDISRLKQAEADARASEERYRNLFDNMTEGFAIGEAISDDDGLPKDFRFLEVNDAFELQSGLTRDIVGRPMTEVLPNLEHYWIDQYCSVALSGQPARFENYNIDTNRHYEVFCYSPARGRFAILFYDITDRKRAEAALRESEERFKVIASNTPDHILVQDRDLRYTFVINPQLGMSEQQMLGMTDHQILTQAEADKLTRIKRQVLETGKAIHLEVPLHTPKGELEFFEGSFVPKHDSRGEIDGLIGYFRNVTRRKRTEKALAESEAALQELNRQLRAVNETLELRVAERTADLELRTIQLRALAGQLTRAEERERRRVANMLHDSLQQLLVGARFSLESLRMRSKGLPQAQGLQDVENAICECISSTRSLTAELSPTVLYQGGLAAALKWLAQWYREKHGLAVILETETEVEVEPEETRIALFQSVRELLFNVVKHAQVKTARVRLDRTRDGAVRIVVSDDGAGFDSAEVRAREGTGGAFGLFTLRERLELLGGSLEVASSRGQGSRFTILAPLPVQTGTEPQGREIPSVPPVRAGGPGERPDTRDIRILIADDHTLVREGLALALGDEPGLAIVGQAGNGEAAVELTRRLQPDVVLMDVSMPLMNGIEATRLIKSEFHHIKIIGLSMYDDGSHADAMRQAGAAAFLDKSDAVTNVIAAIRKCIGEGELSDQSRLHDVPDSK